MNEVFEFLTENPTFYLATIDGDQARVRPFGAIAKFEDKLYFVTNNKKDVFKQLTANPKVEISTTSKKGEWIRLSGNAVVDPRREAKVAMLEIYIYTFKNHATFKIKHKWFFITFNYYYKI